MKPLILLIVTFVFYCVISKLITHDYHIIFAGNLAMCLMLFLTASGHFLFAKGMTMMMPQAFPFKTGLVYITGVAEALLGIALLTPFRPDAGYTLILFFVLILPANIYAATKNLNLEKADHTGPGLKYLWFRVPMQVFLIGWLIYFSI